MTFKERLLGMEMEEDILKDVPQFMFMDKVLDEIKDESDEEQKEVEEKLNKDWEDQDSKY